MRLKTVLSVLLILLALNSPGQIKRVGTPFTVNFPKSVYNAGMQIWDIGQDSNGFLYFANTSGVIRFDGFHWDMLNVPGSSPVRSVTVDSSGRIYIGKGNDFGFLSITGSGEPSYKSLRYLLPEGFPDFEDIWRIYDTNRGIVFQCYDYIFVYENDKIEIIKPENRFHFSFQVNNRIILHEPDLGLYELVKNSLIKLEWSDKLKDYDIEALFDYGGGDLLVGTARNGIYLLKDNKLEPWNSPVSKYLKENVLFSSEKLAHDQFAWGTILDGLIVSDRGGNIIQHINRKAGMQNNTVLDLFKDQNDNLWVGLDNGISYLEINSPLSFISDPDLLGSGYSCIVHDNYLYLGTNRGLFYKSWDNFQNNRGDFKLVDGTEGQVWSIQEFDGQLICGHNLGTFLIKNRKAIKISDEEGAWKYIRLAGHDDLLLGGHYSGLVLLKKGINGWTYYKTIEGFKESCRFLFQDRKGNIWMSHGGKGVYRLSLDENLNNVVSFKLYNSKGGLPSDERNILMNTGDEMMISTIKGIYQYDEESDSFSFNERLNDIFAFNDRVMLMTPDKNGNIWYICEGSSGVMRVNEDKTYTRIVSPFSKLQGSFVNEFEFIYPMDDDNIFFGTDNGFAHYTSELKKSYSDDFKVFITRVELSYLDSTLYLSDVTDSSDFVFPFRDNSFRFHFASPFYENLDRLRFSYHLENFEGSWCEWTDETYKDYTNLREGDYRFIVKATNVYGIESTYADFSFTVLPPWYRSNLAYYCYILIFIIILIFTGRFARLRVERSKLKQIELHNRELKEKEEKFQREVLIAEKELIKIRNEKLRNEMVHRDKELANQTMGIIQKNRFLIKLKDELSDVKANASSEQVKAKMASLDRKIDREINAKQQNKVFETYFEGVHSEFFKRLKEKHPTLTTREMYLSAYLRMNLTTKEISALQNITDRGVEIGRYRLRKKLGIPRETNLSTYLSNI